LFTTKSDDLQDTSTRNITAATAAINTNISINMIHSHGVHSHPSLEKHESRDMNPKILLKQWRDLPEVNPTVTFPTLVIPSSSVQHFIQHPDLQPFLAKPRSWDFLQNVHPRIKLIQKYNQTHKQLLLLPEYGHGSDEVLQSIVDNHESVRRGPPFDIQLSYKQLSFAYILQQLLPTHLLPPPSAYEQVGHVAHFNLKPGYAEYQHLIGEVLVETASSIQTVVQKVGQVSGKYRTYELEILADVFGKDNGHLSQNSLETTVVEDGVSIQLNVAECYWCTRLSGERQEVIQEILQGGQLSNEYPLVVADVFCGVGAICLLLAKKRQGFEEGNEEEEEKKPNKGDKALKSMPISSAETSSIRIVANDWNPKAIDYFQQSIDGNNLDASQFELCCLDAYDFLIALGTSKDSAARMDNENHAVTIQNRLPDHVLMNFPLDAPKFLGALRWWSWEELEQRRHETFGKDRKRLAQFPRFHVYTFARATRIGANDEEEVAVDIVANELLPQIAPDNDDDDKMQGVEITKITHRRQEFNNEFGTDINTRLVRDVAPGKVVVCVSFSLTPILVRYMQGDYS
jgi:tRNA (guanine37-N1)-methyltransferase